MLRESRAPLIPVTFALLVLQAIAAPGARAAGPDETTSAGEPGEALVADATWYADRHGVSLDEAIRRLRLQTAIGDLDAALAQKLPEIFAGLWIEHAPEYTVRALFTDPAAGRRAVQRRAGRALAVPIRVGSARWSLAELEALQNDAMGAVHHLGVRHDSDIDVEGNRVVIYVEDRAALDRAIARSGLRLPGAVEVEPVRRLSTPDANILGGAGLRLCSGGFTVRSFGVGELGTTTAAHCDNFQTWGFGGPVLPLRNEDQQGHQDVQWHAAPCGCTVTNELDSGIGIRRVTGTRARNSQALGSLVCKNGRVSGRTCGDISSRWISPSYVAGSRATFIRVDGDGDQLAVDGDSGAPWFVEDLAYGIHSGSFDNGDAVYMAVEYMASIGVTVLTFDPGTGGDLEASLSCSGNRRGSLQVTCNAELTGGTPPFDYDWSYSGSAPSWSSLGSSAYAYYSGSGCASGNVNFFSVEVTDACGRSDSASIGPLSCW